MAFLPGPLSGAIEACATFSVGLILEPWEGWIVTSSMLTPRQTNRPKRALTSMCMEVTYTCRLLGLSLLLALVDFAHMQQSRQRDCYTRSATLARNVNVVKRTCEGTDFAWNFRPDKSEVRFRKNVSALPKKSFLNVSYTWRRKCFNRSKPRSLRKNYYIILIFFTTIEGEESLAKSSRMLQYCECDKTRIATKMKPSRQDTIVT